MTTARTFTSHPTVLPEPKQVTIDGIRLGSPQPPADQAANPEADGYWSLTLRSRLAIPGSVLDTVSGSVSIDKSGVTGVNQAQAIPILRDVIDPDDLPALEALIVDKDRVVDISTLWEVAMYFVGELTGRPTGGSGG